MFGSTDATVSSERMNFRAAWERVIPLPSWIHRRFAARCRPFSTKSELFTPRPSSSGSAPGPQGVGARGGAVVPVFSCRLGSLDEKPTHTPYATVLVRRLDCLHPDPPRLESRE